MATVGAPVVRRNEIAIDAASILQKALAPAKFDFIYSRRFTTSKKLSGGQESIHKVLFSRPVWKPSLVALACTLVTLMSYWCFFFIQFPAGSMHENIGHRTRLWPTPQAAHRQKKKQQITVSPATGEQKKRDTNGKFSFEKAIAVFFDEANVPS